MEKFGDHVTAAASQPYYLDVTHPQANKGEVARYLARRYELEPEEIATIGDMPNDILMFAHSGLSIAMGNADPEAKQAAHETSRSNEEEGFAYAVEHFVLPAAAPEGRRPADQTPRWFSKRAYCFKNSRLALPVGPFRCLATSISASSARSIGTSSLYSDSR